MIAILGKIAGRLAQLTGLEAKQIHALLQQPPRQEMGDYSFACFAYAKRAGRSPADVAEELRQGCADLAPEATAEAAGGYLNFRIQPKLLISQVIEEVRATGPAYGGGEVGGGRVVLIDYSSPNIAKHLGIHHLRSVSIGRALYNIHKALGYRTVSLNHLGDWGTQFGQLIAAYKRWGGESKPEDLTVEDLQNLYVRFHAEAENDEALSQEARDWFQKLEEGDAEARGIWQCFRDVSLREYERVYGLLGVRFDRYTGESMAGGGAVEDWIGTVRQALADQKTSSGEDVCRVSEGALVADLSDFGMPPCILLKSDGTSIYQSRDVYTAEMRAKEYAFDKCIYVVGSEQRLHFRQVFKTLELMGYDWAKSCVHVDFGLIRFRDPETGQARKGSTRKGEVILLEDLLQEAVSRAAAKMRENTERFADVADDEQIARDIGIGAAVFADLSTRRTRDVVFDWDAILDFEGDTGPYVQYAHARICSILRKCERGVPESFDAGRLELPEEFALAKSINAFPAAVQDAARNYEPSILATYLLGLCAAFSRYYNLGNRERALRVLCDEETTSGARVALADAARQTIHNGLTLLGIQAPERM